MTNFDRVTEQVNRIKGTTDTWFTGKELKEIPSIIHEDEDVVYFTSGTHKSNGNTMVIVLTTKRIIFLDKGMFVSRQQFDIALDMVNSVQSYMGIMLGRVTIVHGAHSEILENVNKETAKKFQELSTKQIEIFKKEHQNKHANMFAEALKKSNVGGTGSSKVKFLKIGSENINCNHIININMESGAIVVVTAELSENRNKRYYIPVNGIEDCERKMESIKSFMEIETLEI